MARIAVERHRRLILTLTFLMTGLVTLLMTTFYPTMEGHGIYSIFLLILIGLCLIHILNKDAELHEMALRLEIERFQARLDSLLRLALEFTDANRASIMLIDHESGALGVVSAFNVNPTAVASSWTLIGDGIAGHVVRTKEPVFLSGEVRGDRFRKVVQKADRIKEAICVPLMSGPEVIGTLSTSLVGEPGRSFSDRHRTVVGMFARHILLDKESIATLIRFKRKGLA